MATITVDDDDDRSIHQFKDVMEREAENSNWKMERNVHICTHNKQNSVLYFQLETSYHNCSADSEHTTTKSGFQMTLPPDEHKAK